MTTAYVINWDSIAHDSRDFLVMGDPFETYNDEVDNSSLKPHRSQSHEDPNDFRKLRQQSIEDTG